MRFLIPVVILAIASVSCRDTRPRSQDWVVSAPEKSAVGVSCHLGWVMERPEFRKLVTQYPMFDQALELFLDRAAIDPTSETGRISFYLMEIPGIANTSNSRKDAREMEFGDLRGAGLLQMAGFKDPRAIQRVVVETFAPEGTLAIGGREYPLFVVLDINNVHIRVFFDSNERLWIGDLKALQEIAGKRDVGGSTPLSRASEWISSNGAIQGFVQPELLPKDAIKDFADAVPVGLKAMVWSVTPTEKDEKMVNFDLAATGTEDAITQLKPWMQRITSMVSTLAGEGGRHPETIQERNRMGIRSQFKTDQLENVLNTINLDGLIALPVDGEIFKPQKSEAVQPVQPPKPAKPAKPLGQDKA